MRASLIITLLMLSACGDFGSYGHDFNMASAHRLVVGVATEADARKLLGEPTGVENAKESDHRLLEWTYGYYSIGASHIKHLAISFDANGHMLKIVAESDS